MLLGVSIFLTDDGINVADLSRALEAWGFESLFCPEHIHIPTDIDSVEDALLVMAAGRINQEQAGHGCVGQRVAATTAAAP
jgi:alkanesulfonate monooxygenase SsuD/methylene tetrahydromethanopterin reductase-like flavin-dependent oxidoreductase (luciferase family)